VLTDNVFRISDHRPILLRFKYGDVFASPPTKPPRRPPPRPVLKKALTAEQMQRWKKAMGSRSGPHASRAAGWSARLSNTGAPCAAEVTELIIQHGIEEAKACGAEFHEPAPAGDPQHDAQKSRRPVHMTRSEKRRYDAAFANLRLCRAYHKLLTKCIIGELSASDLAEHPKAGEYAAQFSKWRPPLIWTAAADALAAQDTAKHVTAELDKARTKMNVILSDQRARQERSR